MTIKQYIIEVSEYVEVTLVVDHSVATEDIFKDLNEFWCGSKRRFEKEGSHALAAIKLIAEKCAYVQLEGQLNNYGTMKAFGKDQGQEGYLPLDGTCGIMLKHVDAFEFEAGFTKTSELTEFPPLPKGNW